MILLDNSDFVSENIAEITDARRLEHLLQVLKVAPGKICKVGILSGFVGQGEVLRVAPSCVALRVTAGGMPPAKLPLTLIMALPRPKTLRKVLHAAVSMGAEKIFFIGSFKVEKSYWDSPWLDPEFLRQEQLLALEQSGDTRMAEIHFRRFFKPFVEDELPALIASSPLLIAHPGVAKDMDLIPSGFVTLVLGPEGGFTDYELNLLERAGGRRISLGNRILRTEFALAALMGRMMI